MVMHFKWKLLIIIKDRIIKKMAPLHPGEVLQEEFLVPMNMSQNKLAIALHVPARRINEIVLGK